MVEEFKFSDITEKIIRAALEVHNFLGNGFQEVIYQRALVYEFRKTNLNFQREVSRSIFYKDQVSPIGTRRADFVVEDKVLVEIKATSELTDVHFAQILNYLRAYKIEVGLLINFGAKSLQFKRFILSPKSS